MARLCAVASPGTNRAIYGSQVKRMLGLLRVLSSCAETCFYPLLGFYSMIKEYRLNLFLIIFIASAIVYI
jgi:hypothetical protein